jgi:hypothetical protein
MTPAGTAVTEKAIKLLNARLYGDLGLTDGEERLLIGLLMRMRQSWDDIEDTEGWAPFEIDPVPNP